MRGKRKLSMGQWILQARRRLRLTVKGTTAPIDMTEFDLGNLEGDRQPLSEEKLRQLCAVLGLDFEEAMERSFNNQWIHKSYHARKTNRRTSNRHYYAVKDGLYYAFPRKTLRDIWVDRNPGATKFVRRDSEGIHGQMVRGKVPVIIMGRAAPIGPRKEEEEDVAHKG